MRVPEYAERLNDLASRREAFAIATVTKTEGSTLAKPGFKILISGRGEVVRGTLGGGCPEGPICEVALRAMREGSPRIVRVHLVDAARAVAGTVQAASDNEIYVETDCGGTLEVFVEPMLPTERLILVGQGGRDDIEDALVYQGKALGFEVVVVDPMPDLREMPDAIVNAAEIDPKAFPIGNRDSIVVLTKGERDVSVLEALSKTEARFVGLLASRRRLKKDLEELERRGVTKDFLSRLHAPIGLDIGARTPPELALAIMADVLATKYGRDVPHKPEVEETAE
ncbi:MAG: XdhC family protein [Methanobacteriota archaeon]|nr:MAG: XdhC family protein [Euryarchaeota archaeon]